MAWTSMIFSSASLLSSGKPRLPTSNRISKLIHFKAQIPIRVDDLIAAGGRFAGVHDRDATRLHPALPCPLKTPVVCAGIVRRRASPSRTGTTPSWESLRPSLHHSQP